MEIVYEARSMRRPRHRSEKRMQGRDHPVTRRSGPYYLKCFIPGKSCEPRCRASAARARQALKRMARPAGDFDASRYFREQEIRFHSIGTSAMRELAARPRGARDV